MRLSVSNLAWGAGYTAEVARILLDAGVEGVELAPTAIWPGAPFVDRDLVDREVATWSRVGLPVVAVQSLLFGHPELRLFEPASHDALRQHLTAMIRLAGRLGAGVAVFGSPRNRVRGDLDDAAADRVAGDFFASLTTVLADEGVVLTLEPNAPQYGADYLTTYADCRRLASTIGSPWVAPQIDTGCLAMAGDDVPAAVRAGDAAHVHVSAPFLGRPPGDVDHAPVRAALREVGYGGWVTLEMGKAETDTLGALRSGAQWLAATYGADR